MAVTPDHHQLVRTLLASVTSHLGLETCLLYELIEGGSAMQLTLGFGVDRQPSERLHRIALDPPVPAEGTSGDSARDPGQQVAGATEAAIYSLGVQGQACR